MGPEARRILLNVFHPKIRWQIFPAAETLLGRGRTEAPRNFPTHVQFKECGRWLFLLGRILPLLAGCWCFTHPSPSIQTTKKRQWDQGRVCSHHGSVFHVPFYPAKASYWNGRECLMHCGETSFSSCFNICHLMLWEKICKYCLLWESTKNSTLRIFPMGKVVRGKKKLKLNEVNV